jgi:hypothetical protein
LANNTFQRETKGETLENLETIKHHLDSKLPHYQSKKENVESEGEGNKNDEAREGSTAFYFYLVKRIKI